jgi:Tfp pilus tip-associated adhesin PilY1
MHQEDAATGKGLPYLATNKDELMDVFRTIMNSVKGAVFFGSAPAATTSTDLGDMVVLASFNAGNWTGEIEAIAKDTTTGKWNASLWKASENMPATRNVWTVDSGNNLTAYTTSTLAGDNYLCKKIGDIVHSTPMVVAAPPFFYAFDNYSSFKRNLSVTNPREKMAYVGSNDGLLHAFSLETGQERWAFLPKSLQAKLNEAGNGASYDPCSTSYCHRYLLDGSPQVADVYGVFGGASKWRTMLVVGQRGGGTAYTALDVTKGESFGAGADQAKFLWELTDAQLGESWSEAAIERVSYPGGGTGATAWGVFVSSGYSENDNTQYLKEGYLYGLEAATGTGLWSDGTTTINKIKVTPEAGTLNFKNLSGAAPGVGVIVRGLTSGAYGAAVVSITNGATGSIVMSNVFNSSFVNNEQIVWSGSSATVDGTFSASTASQKNNALSSPVTGNFYAPDHTEDCIYVGDLYGTMYRVDSIGKGQTPSASKLFKFNPYPSGPDERPIRGKASIAYNEGSSGLWVYYGTGRYETAADKVNNQQQYFFGLKDAATPRATPYSVADLTTLEARFTAATIGGKAMRLRTINGTNTSANPWAMKLFAGQSGWGGPATSGGSERVFTKPLVVGGIVFFTTFIPDADICTGSGDTYVFALDYKTGMPPTSPVFDLNGDGKFTDADKVLINGSLMVPIGLYVGRGQGSAPVLFKDTLFITTSTPQAGSTGSGNVTGLNSLLVNIPQKKIRVESWKHN